jgi:exosortase/archaeosortase family protein
LAVSLDNLNRKVLVRFLCWVGVASVVAALAAPTFPALLSQAVDDAFGTVLPAIPFAALLTVLFLLRWRDIRELLLKEKGFSTEVPTRLAGVGIVASLILLRSLTGYSVYSSALAVILSFYGTSLVLNPLTRRITLSYAVIYALGVSAPAVLQWAFGEPLAAFSSVLSADLLSFGGIPLVWHGTQFQLVSRTGDLVSATVTPGCSSIVSVTTFIGLLALMHIDLKKDFSSTIKLALAGVVVLTVLNAARIAILVWVGYLDGSGAFWGIHNYVGYALFLGFYLVILAVYPRMGQPNAPGVPPSPASL